MFFGLPSHSMSVLTLQISTLKSGVVTRLATWQADLERFVSHWRQFRPGDALLEIEGPETHGALQMVRGHQTDFQVLQAERERLW